MQYMRLYGNASMLGGRWNSIKKKKNCFYIYPVIFSVSIPVETCFEKGVAENYYSIWFYVQSFVTWTFDFVISHSARSEQFFSQQNTRVWNSLGVIPPYWWPTVRGEFVRARLSWIHKSRARFALMCEQ